MRAFAFSAVVATVAGEAVLYGADLGELAGTSALAVRDACPQLPKLCTDAAVLFGQAMTLTYVCPEKTASPTTIHVTVTETTTVTAGPNSSSAEPSKAQPTADEPTTTTTVRSTATIHRTVTVTRKKPAPTSVSAIASKLSIILSQPAVSLTSAPAPISSVSDVQSSTLAPKPTITDKFSVTCPTGLTCSSAFPTFVPVVTEGTTSGIWFSQTMIGSSIGSVSATGSEMATYSPMPSVTFTGTSVPLPVVTDTSSKFPFSSGGISLGPTKPLTSSALPSFSFPNSTASVGYGVPTPRVARNVKASEAPQAPSTGVANMKSISLAALFLGVLATVRFV